MIRHRIKLLGYAVLFISKGIDALEKLAGILACNVCFPKQYPAGNAPADTHIASQPEYVETLDELKNAFVNMRMLARTLYLKDHEETKMCLHAMPGYFAALNEGYDGGLAGSALYKKRQMGELSFEREQEISVMPAPGPASPVNSFDELAKSGVQS